MQSFFFVPLANIRFIEKVKTLDVDSVVYDLEDAVKTDSKRAALNNCALIENIRSAYVRPQVYQNYNQNMELFRLLHAVGFKKFVIPKVDSVEQFRMINKILSDMNEIYEVILLIENPSLLFKLQDILENWGDKISGLSLGSHDYCNSLNAKHKYTSYCFAHDYVLNLAKAFQKKAIDIASMEIQNKSSFIDEVKQNFDKGYRYKFILHPLQLDYLKDVEYFDEDEIRFAKEVSLVINLDSDFDAIEVNGRILEKPHIERIREILQYQKYGIK